MTPLLRSLSLLLLSCAVLPLPAWSAAPAARVARDDTLARCNWDRPGRNPFTGDVVAAIDRYRDIPTPVRMKLKQRMSARQYDDLVDIRRDSIEGKFQYAAAIRDMHFGAGRVCREVTRQRWTDKTHERGLVYCEGEHCILVPTVCRNVSRIDRGPSLVAGDRLLAPPGTTPADALASGDRREVPMAAAPAAPGSSPPAPAEPITSSFAEAVAGAAVPLFPGADASTPLEEGSPPGGLIIVPGDDPAEGDPLLPPFDPIPGGGGGPLIIVPGGVVAVVAVAAAVAARRSTPARRPSHRYRSRAPGPAWRRAWRCWRWPCGVSGARRSTRRARRSARPRSARSAIRGAARRPARRRGTRAASSWRNAKG